jgi:hypothetical protein
MKAYAAKGIKALKPKPKTPNIIYIIQGSILSTNYNNIVRVNIDKVVIAVNNLIKKSYYGSPPLSSCFPM